MQSLQTLRSITSRYDHFEQGSAIGSRSMPGSAAGTPRAPPSARKFLFVQKPSPRNQAFVVQKPSRDTGNHRPGREMGVSTVKLAPHSQPWYRPQLDETMEELDRSRREVLKLKEVVTSIAKERDAAFESGRRSAEIITQKAGENRALASRIDGAEEEAKRARFGVEEMAREKEVLSADNLKLKGRITQLVSELENLKAIMNSYLEDRIKAERSSAEASVSAAQAVAEGRKATFKMEELARERDHAQAVAAAAEKLRLSREAQDAAEAERAERERRARLEARVISVPADTKEHLGRKVQEVSLLAEEQLLSLSSKYVEPDPVWDLLEPRSYSGYHDAPVVLLSAAWLRTQRPTKLPDRSQLPPEALIPVRSLRAINATIDKGMAKGMSRPLPIIAILHPRMRLGELGGSTHPDPDGEYLELIQNTLDQRWSDYTRRRGGAQSTGVTDMGVFFEWSSLYMSPSEGGSGSAASVRHRTPHEARVFSDALSELHVLFAHKLTTVWCIQEAPEPIGPLQLMYTHAWPSYLKMLATLVKPSNMNDTNAWPQLLRLGDDADRVKLDRAEQEKVPRGAPFEPFAFRAGHKLGALEGRTSLLESQLADATFSLLAGVEELDFRRCNWGDEECAWLAIMLPICGNLRRLILSNNRIGNLGASALANALSNQNLQRLELLALDNNLIGDSGASALFQRMSPNEEGQLVLHELKTLQLNNNELSDAAITALSGAVAGGALKGCKKVVLDGNPASKATVKAVKKALKKSGK